MPFLFSPLFGGYGYGSIARREEMVFVIFYVLPYLARVVQTFVILSAGFRFNYQRVDCSLRHFLQMQICKI